jgi:acyl-coenzyme A synthetase/AMP-(fatty) acid ligase
VAILLAAGVSSRMNTKLPKVLHEVTGRPMLAYVLDACRSVGVDKIYVIVGFGAEQVRERFAEEAADIVRQQPQLARRRSRCTEHPRISPVTPFCAGVALIRARLQTHRSTGRAGGGNACYGGPGRSHRLRADRARCLWQYSGHRRG